MRPKIASLANSEEKRAGPNFEEEKNKIPRGWGGFEFQGDECKWRDAKCYSRAKTSRRDNNVQQVAH